MTTDPTYTFVSVSTAKPGRLDDLVAAARRPGERMDGVVAGMLGRQVAVDRDRNTVIVWSTFADRADLYDHLATEAGQVDHDDVDLSDVIDSFEMFDLTPVSGRLGPLSPTT